MMEPAKRKKILKQVLLYFWIVVTAFFAVVTIVSAYGGAVNPMKATWPAILAMVFPILWLTTLLLGVINFFIKRWLALIPLGVLIVTVSPFLHFCPLNIFKTSLDGKETFKVMSYNAFGFCDYQGIYPDNTNRTATQIIGSNADFVLLQESGTLREKGDFHVSQAQMDSIEAIYPYRIERYQCYISLYSRTPLRIINLEQPDSPQAGWFAAETVLKGDTILLVSMHLQSIGLDENDKEVYSEMTKGSKDVHWRSASRTLLGKLSQAFKKRAVQAEKLHHQIDSLGYRNVIVAGDFNDINLCYAQRVLCEGKMKSAFFEAGVGPEITYHSNRFYFHIDHILYQGNFKAARFSCGKVKSSDHYPIYATFVME